MLTTYQKAQLGATLATLIESHPDFPGLRGLAEHPPQSPAAEPDESGHVPRVAVHVARPHRSDLDSPGSQPIERSREARHHVRLGNAVVIQYQHMRETACSCPADAAVVPGAHADVRIQPDELDPAAIGA